MNPGRRQLSRSADVRLYVRTLAFAWRWTAAMHWADPPATITQLERTNALVDSNEAQSQAIRLVLP